MGIKVYKISLLSVKTSRSLLQNAQMSFKSDTGTGQRETAKLVPNQHQWFYCACAIRYLGWIPTTNMTVEDLKHRNTCLHLCRMNFFANACRTLNEIAPSYFRSLCLLFPWFLQLWWCNLLKDFTLKRSIFKEAQSEYLELFWPRSNATFKLKEPWK